MSNTNSWSNAPEKTSVNDNKIYNLLSITAWLIYIAGFGAGIFLSNIDVQYTYISSTYTEFSFRLAITYWVASFITGSLFLGLAEIIKLLQQIVDKQSFTNPNSQE